MFETETQKEEALKGPIEGVQEVGIDTLGQATLKLPPCMIPGNLYGGFMIPTTI